MTNILYPPPRPQSVGEILDTSFRIFRATLLKCLPYATIAMVAGQLPNLYKLISGRPLYTPLQQERDPTWWVLYFLGSLIAGVLGSAILLRQYALATGHPAALGTELSTGLRRFPAILLLGVLVGLALAGSLVPLALAFIFHGWLRFVMIVLLLLPASWMLIALSSAWTILLVTGKGALESLKHSARLTRGSWWRLTIIYTVALVLLLVLYSLSTMIAAVVALAFAHGDLVMITAITTVLVVILSAIGTPFYCGLMLAVLGDLSVRKEGADLAQRIAAPATQ